MKTEHFRERALTSAAEMDFYSFFLNFLFSVIYYLTHMRLKLVIKPVRKLNVPFFINRISGRIRTAA